MLRIRDFRDLVAVVTGAGSGIGRAIAVSLASVGARVVVVDIDEAGAYRTAEEVGGVARVLDVTNSTAVAELARELRSDFGCADILVNNAGICPVGRFDDVSMDDCRRVMDVNFWGALHMLQQFLPMLVKSVRGGYVVSVLSVAALLPKPKVSVYAASKAALLALTESLSQEFAGARLGWTNVMPGPVRTNIFGASESAAEGYALQLPAGEVRLDPECVGAAVLDALRQGRPSVFTHAESKERLRAKFNHLLDAYPGGPRGT